MNLQSVKHLLARRRRSKLIRRLDYYLVQLHEGCENRDYDSRRNGERRALEVIASVSSPKAIFDVGANVGEWSLLASSICPEATTYCFEPVSETFESLAANVAGQSNLVPLNLALADSAGERNIHYLPAGHALATFVDGFTEAFHGVRPQQERVRVTTGDLFCAERNIDFVDFLKIDVEGYEDRVLKGFAAMLNAGRIRVIQFEYGYVSISTRFLLKDFYELLQPYGMQIGKIFPTHVDFRDYKYQHEDFIGPNFLAVRSTDDSLIRAL